MSITRMFSTVILCTMLCIDGYEQTADPVPDRGVQVLPEPYKASEFPAWMIAVRRYEIISLGAFPIILFYTRFGFDIQRYIQNGFSPAYVPWPFKNENSYVPTDAEQVQSVLTAAGLAVVFGALDAILVNLRLD